MESMFLENISIWTKIYITVVKMWQGVGLALAEGGGIVVLTDKRDYACGVAIFAQMGNGSFNDYRCVMKKQRCQNIFRFLFVWILAFMVYSFSGCSLARVSRDIEKYGQFRKNDMLHESEILIFPEDLSEAKQVNEYVYLFDTIAWGGTQIYLDVTYDEETFAKEREYWSNYKYDDTVVDDVPPKFDDAYLFNYPTFVFEYQSVEYQYISVIEQECRMIYVYIEIGSDEVIPDEFLPKNYYKNTYGADDEDDGYLFSIKSVHDESWYE
ncbi:MAG: hypothetical protein E7367_00360 [Clostridiales bacterium]|nr:hypothetical protein [Clostridiales bacterium]